MAISGQKKVTAAGTAVALGATPVHGPLLVRALPGNTGNVAIGNDGANDVTLQNGLVLGPGQEVRLGWVGSLGSIWLDAAVNGEGVAWMMSCV